MSSAKQNMAKGTCPKRALISGMGLYFALPPYAVSRQMTASPLQLFEWEMMRKKKEADGSAAERVSGSFTEAMSFMQAVNKDELTVANSGNELIQAQPAELEGFINKLVANDKLKGALNPQPAAALNGMKLPNYKARLTTLATQVKTIYTDALAKLPGALPLGTFTWAENTPRAEGLFGTLEEVNAMLIEQTDITDGVKEGELRVAFTDTQTKVGQMFGEMLQEVDDFLAAPPAPPTTELICDTPQKTTSLVTGKAAAVSLHSVAGDALQLPEPSSATDCEQVVTSLKQMMAAVEAYFTEEEASTKVADAGKLETFLTSIGLANAEDKPADDGKATRATIKVLFQKKYATELSSISTAVSTFRAASSGTAVMVVPEKMLQQVPPAVKAQSQMVDVQPSSPDAQQQGVVNKEGVGFATTATETIEAHARPADKNPEPPQP